MQLPLDEAILGCILGTAVGDAIGLPAEGLSPHRQRKLFGPLKGHRLLLGRGTISDDTEHTCLVAEALAHSAGDVIRFRDRLADGLRWWLLSLPVGTGLATLRGTVKLWLGVAPDRSGVFSAGNGPAMRSALIGVCYARDSGRVRDLVRVSTRITHTDPKAEWAAFAVALAAGLACRGQVRPSAFQEELQKSLGPEAAEFLALTGAGANSAERGDSTRQFAESMGLAQGASGYCYESVPIALHAWLAHQGNYRMTVLSAIGCGGDTDTTGAIAGAIAGAQFGVAEIPEQWVRHLCPWPRTSKWIQGLAHSLTLAVESGQSQHPKGLPYAGLLLRNVLFAAIVITHGLRRLLPPY